MGLKYGFYPTEEGTIRDYTEDDVGGIFDGFMTDGIYYNIGNRFYIHPSDDGKHVIIDPGRGWFNHTYTLLEEPMYLNIPTGSTTPVDIFLVVNKRQMVNSIEVKDHNAEPIELPGIYYYKLATISNTITPIEQSSITSYIGLKDGVPYVVCIPELLLLYEIMEPLIKEWNKWFDDTKDSWLEWMTATNMSWLDWFNDTGSAWSTWFNATDEDWDTWFNATKRDWDTWFGPTKSDWNTWFETTKREWNKWFDSIKVDMATKTYVDDAIANLINGAPETLDTLNELAEAMTNNYELIQVLDAAITNKVDISSVKSDYDENGYDPVNGVAVSKALGTLNGHFGFGINEYIVGVTQTNGLIYAAVSKFKIANNLQEGLTPSTPVPMDGGDFFYPVLTYNATEAVWGGITLNAKTKNGLVPPGNGHSNSVWGTDNGGNPGWLANISDVKTDCDRAGASDPSYILDANGKIRPALENGNKLYYQLWAINVAFGALNKVATTGKYSDLKDTPPSLPANGGTADTISQTLPISKGGTGKTNAADAFSALAKEANNANDAFNFGDEDSILFVQTSASNSLGFKGKFSKLWTYINNKIKSVNLRAKNFITKTIAVSDLKDNFRTHVYGSSSSGEFLTVCRNNTSNDGVNKAYDTGLAFGCADTQGWICPAYNEPSVVVGAGNGNNLDWIRHMAFLEESVQKSGDIMTGDLHIEKNFLNSGGGFFVKDTVKGTQVWLGVGSGQVDHGVFSKTLNKWIVYADATSVYLKGNADTATKLQTARTIDGVSFNGSAAIIHYGTCSTAASTAAKVVSCTGFTLVTGAEITVKFTTTNTAANPTLNVNGTGAKAIQYRGSAITAGYLAANRTYRFLYDGTNYQLVGDINTDTTTDVSGKVSKTGDDMSGTLGSTKTTSTYLAGNQGQAIINSKANAGAYTMLDKLNSTNGYFTDGVYQNKRLLQYTAKTTVDAGTNAVTKSATLLDESGNTSFPGTVTASAFSGNASSATKATNDKNGKDITTTYATKTEVDTLKKSVSDGKTSVANAITAKGVQTATDATFATMAENIGKIQTGSNILLWENTSNGSYKFEKSGDRWIANNRGVNSSTATSTWKVTVSAATTAYIGWRTSCESYDKLSITLNGSSVLSATGGIKESETVITLNLTAGENTLVASYVKDSSSHVYGDMAYVVLPPIGEQPGQYKYESRSLMGSPGETRTLYPDNGYDGICSVTVTTPAVESGGVESLVPNVDQVIGRDSTIALNSDTKYNIYVGASSVSNFKTSTDGGQTWSASSTNKDKTKIYTGINMLKTSATSSYISPVHVVVLSS